MKTKHYTTITHNGIELELVGVYTKGKDAYISGAPDDCYDGENPTFDVDEITLIDSNINIISLFSSDDIDEIESKAVNNLTD